LTSLPNFLLPADDEARLRALERYQVLDARREKILDDVVAATAQLFRVSNAMLSMVEETQVLVKAPYNLPTEVSRFPRAQSLCSATILQSDTAILEDINQGGAPGVDISLMEQMGLRFYAGHSLRTPDGYNIGTLCLVDDTPRSFPPAERHLLSQLADLVMHLLELRRILGPHSPLTSMLWGTVYGAMSEQLACLTALAERAVPTSGPYLLTSARARQASVIVASLDQFVTATLRRS
jgi:hypothetical protein